MIIRNTRSPIKKANLNQAGGEDVKVSNGEYAFTPEEVIELKAKGIDVDALAPDAKNHLTEYLKCGGKVKGYGGGGEVKKSEDRLYREKKVQENLDEYYRNSMKKLGPSYQPNIRLLQELQDKYGSLDDTQYAKAYDMTMSGLIALDRLQYPYRYEDFLEVREMQKNKNQSNQPQVKQNANSQKPLLVKQNANSQKPLLSPQEILDLKAKGINIDQYGNDLDINSGGNAKEYKGYAKGGDVEVTSVDVDDDEKFINDKRKALDALKNELNIAAAKKDKTAEEKRIAQNKKIAYDAAKERFDNSVKEFQKAKDVYKRYEEALKTDKYSGGTSANLGKLKAELDNVDKLRRKVKENADVIEKSNPSVKTTTTSSNKESSTGLDFMSGDKPKVPVLSSSTGAEIEKKLGTQEKAILKAPSAKSIKKAEAEQALTQLTDLDKKIAAEGDTTLSDLADLERFNKSQKAPLSESGLARLANQDVNTNGELEAALASADERNKVDPKVDYGNSLSKGLTSLFDYGIPLAQTAVGLSFLNKQGKRPVDKLDPDYLASIESSQGIANEAKKRAQFGFTPEEQFLIDQRNQGLLNQGRAAARNYSGGSAGNAFNQERLSINDSFNRGLAAKVQGQNLMLGKQQYADAKQAETNRMMGDKAEMSRRLFNDTLGAWQQNQSAGASLVNTGLSNLVSAGRYRNELDMYNDRKQKYGI